MQSNSLVVLLAKYQDTQWNTELELVILPSKLQEKNFEAIF